MSIGHIIILAARREDKLEAITKYLIDQGFLASYQICDVTDKTDVLKLQ